MKPGDLVVPAYNSATVHEKMHPTFSSQGLSREWESGQIALVTGLGVRKVGGFDVPKIQILLEGKLWWTGTSRAKIVGGRDEAR
jgi:hypothetical protein